MFNFEDYMDPERFQEPFVLWQEIPPFKINTPGVTVTPDNTTPGTPPFVPVTSIKEWIENFVKYGPAGAAVSAGTATGRVSEQYGEGLKGEVQKYALSAILGLMLLIGIIGLVLPMARGVVLGEDGEEKAEDIAKVATAVA